MTCITDTTSSDRQVNLIIIFTERARFTKKTKPTLLNRREVNLTSVTFQCNGIKMIEYLKKEYTLVSEP